MAMQKRAKRTPRIVAGGNLENVLFFDTEFNSITKQPKTLQLRMNGKNVIIDLRDDSKEPETLQYEMNGKVETVDVIYDSNRKIFKEWLKQAKCIVAWNILIDTGLASSLKDNSYTWFVDKKGTGAWKFVIEGYKYNVKALNKVFSKLESFGKAAPLFDLLKYWTLMISGKPRKLGDVIWEEFQAATIPWSEENSDLREYQLEDVVWLEQIYLKFFEKIANVPEVQGYDAYDWQRVCTQASLCKMEYEKIYGVEQLKAWQLDNWKADNKFQLQGPLEQAYNGGITIAMCHGSIVNSAWYDINAAYANVICNENTDRYKHYMWEEVSPITPLARDGHPLLCKVETYSVMDKIQNSLKIYKTKVKSVRWMWSSDILTMRLLHPETEIVVTRALKPVPLNDVEESAVKTWKDRRESLPGNERSGPYGLFLKALCNTAYGITAQRKPKTTPHTNMVIAGIITSRAHLILAEMVDEARKAGCYWGYSDTDSICVDLNGADPKELLENLNTRIAPYKCGCDLVGETFILSLKRYIAEGVDLNGEPVKPKVRVHGKATYDINEDTIYKLAKGDRIYKPLLIKKTTARTPVGMKLCMNRDPRIKEEFQFPFMFIENTPARWVDENGEEYTPTITDWWEDTYRIHIDTKTTVPKGAQYGKFFKRDWHVFGNARFARGYFDGMTLEPHELDAAEMASGSYVDWDTQSESMYGKDLIDSLRKDLKPMSVVNPKHT